MQPVLIGGYIIAQQTSEWLLVDNFGSLSFTVIPGLLRGKLHFDGQFWITKNNLIMNKPKTRKKDDDNLFALVLKIP